MAKKMRGLIFCSNADLSHDPPDVMWRKVKLKIMSRVGLKELETRLDYGYLSKYTVVLLFSIMKSSCLFAYENKDLFLHLSSICSITILANDSEQTPKTFRSKENVRGRFTSLSLFRH